MDVKNRLLVTVIACALVGIGFLAGLVCYDSARKTEFGGFFLDTENHVDLEFALKRDGVNRSQIDRLRGNLLSALYYWKSDPFGYRAKSAWADDCSAGRVFETLGRSTVGRRSDLEAAAALYKVCFDRSKPEGPDREWVLGQIRRVEGLLTKSGENTQ